MICGSANHSLLDVIVRCSLHYNKHCVLVTIYGSTCIARWLPLCYSKLKDTAAFMRRARNCHHLHLVLHLRGLRIDAATCTTKEVIIWDYVDQTENSFDVLYCSDNSTSNRSSTIATVVINIKLYSTHLLLMIQLWFNQNQIFSQSFHFRVPFPPSHSALSFFSAFHPFHLFRFLF